MSFDYTQGDPLVVIGVNGASTVFKNGQPVMDQGLENDILFSLFSGKAWFGNEFIREPASRIESRFVEATRQPITLTAINADIPDAAQKDLKSLIDNGRISSVDISVRNTASGQIVATFVFHPPGADIFVLEATANGKNWQAQFKYPAHKRI